MTPSRSCLLFMLFTNPSFSFNPTTITRMLHPSWTCQQHKPKPPTTNRHHDPIPLMNPNPYHNFLLLHSFSKYPRPHNHNHKHDQASMIDIIATTIKRPFSCYHDFASIALVCLLIHPPPLSFSTIFISPPLFLSTTMPELMFCVGHCAQFLQ